MAQNDMNIANQGFPGFRADLNDALGALVSNSSGATEPATTFAHQYWVDTSANPSILKIRNADNDAFITIGTINQTGDTFKLTPSGGVSTDTIAELTSAAGVTIDGVLLKDTTVTANTIKASGTASSQGKVEFFEDTDNGTNFVALQAAAAIASDVTFTLPAADGTSGQALVTNGSGALSFATAGGGKVLQVVTTVTTSSTSTTSGSFQDSGLALSITPTSATSKVLVLVNQHIRLTRDDAAGFGFRLVRAGTTILTRDGGDNTGVFINAGTVGSVDFRTQPVIVFLDSPATTSATEYKTQIASLASGTTNAQANANPSTLTLLEIAA